MQMETRYSEEEVAPIGDEIYERKIRPQMEGKYKSQIVAINLETGNYVIGVVNTNLEAVIELNL
jgi:hypothetical protein